MFKKEKFKKFGEYLFLAFLFFYAFSMLKHTLELSLNLQTIVLFLAGLLLAIFAHARQNSITVFLLLLHMSIEWFEWSQITFSLAILLFSLGHAVMDFIFLSHELKAHMEKYRKKILSFISFFLVFIFIIGKVFLSKVSGIDNVVEIVEPFVIAGVLGCVFSHLFYHLRKIGVKEKCC